LRLAWDFAGSALGSRNEQYERFYLGSTGRNLLYSHAVLDRMRAGRLLQEAID
jgi:aromatic ring hydroxylase